MITYKNAPIPGVAKEAVYAIFKNKQRLLAYLLDISAGGDEQRVRLIDRSGPQATLHDADQHRQIAGRVRRLYRDRLDNMQRIAHQIAANDRLRQGLDEPWRPTSYGCSPARSSTCS